MQELEKIMEEIELEKEHASLSPDYSNEYAVAQIFMAEKIEDIIRNHMNDGWILARERLPECNKTVLVCQRRGVIDVAWHDGCRWKTGFSHADWLRDVVAWQPLPEPYRLERSDNHDGE